MIPDNSADTTDDKMMVDEIKISKEKVIKRPKRRTSFRKTTNDTRIRRLLGDFRSKKLHPRLKPKKMAR